MHLLFYASSKLFKFSNFLASHLAIVYKLQKLKGSVLTQKRYKRICETSMLTKYPLGFFVLDRWCEV